MEVAWKGFGSACRYLSLLGAMGVPAFIINPMVRTMAIERGHVSPLELVHDRYRSHVLHLLLACTLVTALFLSCGAQLLALKSVLQTLSLFMKWKPETLLTKKGTQASRTYRSPG